MEPDTRWLIRRGLLISATAFVLGATIVATGLSSNTNVDAPMWTRYATLTAVCVGMFFRRLAPRTGLVIGTIGFFVEAFIGMSLGVMAIYTDNIYSATLRGPRKLPRALLIAGCCLTVVLSAAVYATEDLQIAILVLAVLAMILISPVATGIIVREHRERAELERDKSATIARLAEVDRRAAINAERTRMARELHDTIANHLSAIAMRSSAVLSQPKMDAQAVRAVMSDIRNSSVEGLSEMRGTIDLLRRGESEDEVLQHRLSGLDDLVARMKTAGLGDITVNIRGSRTELPVAVDFAAYRIIQEALTNVLKHGQKAAVEMQFTNEKLSITVDNRMPDVPTDVPGSGNGLVGMRERTNILGGTFSAGPYTDGWRVHAEMPVTIQGKET